MFAIIQLDLFNIFKTIGYRLLRQKVVLRNPIQIPSQAECVMGKLAAVLREKAKPRKNGWDRLLGDADGLCPRIRPHRENRQGTKTWVVEYEFQGRRRKSTIGVYDSAGAPGESISAWLDNGRLWLTQAGSVAGQSTDSIAVGKRSRNRQRRTPCPKKPSSYSGDASQRSKLCSAACVA